MQRIMKPLEAMGARITARDGKFPPLEIYGGPLRPIHYELPVASAQVKTCVLFAGLFADGVTSVTEPARSRDHTEIALREFGAEVKTDRSQIAVTGRPALTGRDLFVPSDLSSAAFFIVAALLTPGSRLGIRGVGLNPTRAALLDFLIGMGAKITIPELESRNGELVGSIVVEHSALRGGVDLRRTDGGADRRDSSAGRARRRDRSRALTVRDAAELRIKETDRIRTVIDNLRRMGVEAEELPDGLVVPGRQKLRGARLDSFGDHRIAMAFAVAALAGGRRIRDRGRGSGLGVVPRVLGDAGRHSALALVGRAIRPAVAPSGATSRTQSGRLQGLKQM